MTQCVLHFASPLPLQLQRQREGAKVLLRAIMHAEMGKGK